MRDSIHLISHVGCREAQWVLQLTCCTGVRTCRDAARVHRAFSSLTSGAALTQALEEFQDPTWTGVWCAVFRSGLGAGERQRMLLAPQGSGLRCFEADPQKDCTRHTPGQHASLKGT